MTAEELIIKAIEKTVITKDISIIDDLIKIGLPILGTVIGTLLGYKASMRQTEKNFEAQIKTAVLTRNTDLDSRFLENKLKHFIEAQNLIDQFINTISDYCANVKNWNDHKKNGNAELQIKAKSNHEELQREFYKGFLLLGTAESRLLILGKSEIHKPFNLLNKKSKEIYESVYIEKESRPNNEITELVEDLKRIKYSLFTELGKEIELEHTKLLQRSKEISTR